MQLFKIHPAIIRFGIVVCAAACIMIPAPLMAVEPLLLDVNGLDGPFIGRHTEYREDANGALGIAEIIAQGDSGFTAAKTDTYGFGYTLSPYWIKITVRNTSTRPMEWFLEFMYPTIMKASLFSQGDANRYTEQTSAEVRKLADRPVMHTTHIFPLNAKPGLQTYYLRVQSDSNLLIPLRAWSRAPLMLYINRSHIIMGMFTGIMLVMFCYNIFLFLSVRRASYLILGLHILSISLVRLEMSGFGYLYLWENSPTLIIATIAPLLLLTTLTGMQFIRTFLDTAINTPRLDRLLLGIIILNTTALACAPFLNFDTALVIAVNAVTLTVVVGEFFGIYYLFQKSRAALYYTIAFSSWMIFGLVNTLTEMCVVPLNTLTYYSAEIGAGIMVTLFSLGLADRINGMRRELADLTVNLEHKIQERTSELQSALEEIGAINDELLKARDALWGEMELAKKIQTVLLPERPTVPGYEITAYMQPAHEIGGDYYDVISLQGHHWIIIGDVSGHGVPAGLVMMMVHTSIQTALAQSPGMAPSELVNTINNVISKNIRKLKENKYMTITVFSCNTGGELCFSGRHQNLIVYRKAARDVELIQIYGMWIGIIDDISEMITDDRLHMEPGDTLLLFTDGITEAWVKDQARHHIFTEDRLIELMRMHGDLSCNEIKSAILRALSEYECNDDVTLLVIKRV